MSGAKDIHGDLAKQIDGLNDETQSSKVPVERHNLVCFYILCLLKLHALLMEEVINHF